MNEDLSNIQFRAIRSHNFAPLFETVRHNGKILTDEDKNALISLIDENISCNSSGLPIIVDSINGSRDHGDTFNRTTYTVSSVLLFVIITMSDCMVATKYFLLANTDFDRRFMRGKMTIILNEGFKRLYGFKEANKKQSEWRRLEPFMNHFSIEIQREYKELTQLLETQSKSSSWWKEERDIETHPKAEKLYLLRTKEIIESEVVIDSMKLFNTLLAVSEFLSNVHDSLLNFLIDKYHRGEILH